MKHRALYLGLAAAQVASCSIREQDFKTLLQDDVTTYYASFEQPAEEGTRVYANEDLLLRWTADDRVSIFGKITYNQPYKFLGETGDNSGGFDKVEGVEYVTGNPISHTVSVYPYQEETTISEEEVLTLTLPSEQHYAENTFGLGANTMVSVSEDNVLQYKSVGGFLRLSLSGEGISVSSITLRGNDGEKLAGKATVTMPLDGTPAVALAEDALDQITLTCDTPVALGATAEESTDFWFVLPPVTFGKGFTITVSGPGGSFEKSTEKTVAIRRNTLSKMSPIEVELSPTQPRNVIYYTSSDGNVVTPYEPEAFGASVLSNEYVDGLGVITFDGDVTSIGDGAFFDCSSLTGITLPDRVASIGDFAFYGCTSLTGITMPDGVTGIGDSAFSSCASLTSITIPDRVTSIRDRAFENCTSLTSITVKPVVPPTGGWNLFSNTNVCPIYVPAGSVEAYKSAQYWSDYADRIQADIDWDLIDGNLWAQASLDVFNWYSQADWRGGLTPEFYLTPDNGFVVTIPEGIGGGEWMGQTHLKSGIATSSEKTYAFSVKLTADKDMTVTLKLTNDPEEYDEIHAFFYDGQVKLTAGEPLVYRKTNLRQAVSGDNVMLVFDFGRSPEGSVIEASEIIFKEQ